MEMLNIPIQLYSACNTVGELTPIWFRFETEEHTIESIRIEKIISHKEQNFCGAAYISFICSAVCDNRMRIFELRYSINTHKWSLFQILS